MGFDPVTMLAAATVASSVIGSKASKSSASTQADAANNAAALQQQQYQQTRSDLQPFVQGGYSAQNRLSDLLGISGNTDASGYGSLTKNFTADDYLKNVDPGYAFQLQQGQKALQNSQAAGDGVLSGAALKGLIDYNQGMASTGYQNAWNRWNTNNQNTYNRLAGLLQLGEAAGAQTGITGATLAGNAGTALMNAGNASAAGTVGAANAVTGAINNGLGYYQLNQLLNKPGGSGGLFTGSGGSAGDIYGPGFGP